MSRDCSAPDSASTAATSPSCAAQTDTSRRCVYCGGAIGQRVYEGVRDRLNYVPGQWSFWRCDGCRSLMLDPMPRAEDLASYYPAIYSYCPELARGSQLKEWLSRFEHRFLYRPLYRGDARRVARGADHASGRGKRLLDVGCGRGLRLVAFRELGYEVAGADFQEEVVRYLQEEQGIPAACCDLATLDQAFPLASFDLVTAYYVLEHMVDPAETVRKCLRLVKPGGWLVVAVPLADSFQARLFRSRWSQVREAPRHVAIPSRKAVEILGRAEGCDAIRFVPDSVRTCAANVAFTFVPGAMTHAAYGNKRFAAAIIRCLGIFAAAAAIPWCWIEEVLLRRPDSGLIFLRKPEGPR